MTVISDTVDEYIEINEDTGQVFIKKPLEKYSEPSIRLIVVVRIFVVVVVVVTLQKLRKTNILGEFF